MIGKRFSSPMPTMRSLPMAMRRRLLRVADGQIKATQPRRWFGRYCQGIGQDQHANRGDTPPADRAKRSQTRSRARYADLRSVPIKNFGGRPFATFPSRLKPWPIRTFAFSMRARYLPKSEIDFAPLTQTQNCCVCSVNASNEDVDGHARNPAYGSRCENEISTQR